ncbi:hypothetical protein Rhopal_000234-T1 [Rhodotorula paludigena]|uniref:Metaxin glutathione S-transferase domain-containing protein n=1 Tax=Rhodotorula paludigena TaxID=86838 RepID=A0AAV5G4B8_9BASI|nr:hypothetical protein Rhopal_000234-T1 [Rhodotorula paludigena]
MPAIPSPLARFFAHFPLVTVPSPHETTAAPAQPTIWAYGPPPAGHAESLDPLCRAAQAYARFIGKADAQVRWMDWEEREAAPGAALPAVHTPDGDLLVGEEVSGWFASQAHPGKGAKDDAATSSDPTQQAYLSLVATTLLPAVLAALYLSPATVAPPVVPVRSRPLLSQVAQTYLTWNDRSRRIDEVKRLRGGKTGKGVVLDLEEVEREAEEAIEALETKMAEAKGEWIGGASSPTRLDALTYAVLSVIRVLPPTCDAVLRPALERSPTLLDWVKRHDP